MYVLQNKQVNISNHNFEIMILSNSNLPIFCKIKLLLYLEYSIDFLYSLQERPYTKWSEETTQVVRKTFSKAISGQQKTMPGML